MDTRAQFDKDRIYGEEGENLLGRILHDKIEVKRERKAAFTGNLAVEYRCRGKKSGIGVTTAKWWTWIWDDAEGYPVAMFTVDIATFKIFLKKHIGEFRRVTGGDHDPKFPKGVSEMVLVPIAELTTFLREFKDFK